jgi:hypothetical protein
MAFSRPNYDSKDVYNLQIKRSIDENEYRLNPLFAENINPCYVENGIVGSKSDVSLVREQTNLSNELMVDAESELSWRSRPLTKDNHNVNPFNKFKIINKKECNSKNSLTPQDTRFTHPLDNYRSMSVFDYELTPYLHTNPQCYIQSIDDKIGLNSRLFAKDSYKNPKHHYWDTGDALPKEIPNKQDKRCLCVNLDSTKPIPDNINKAMLSPECICLNK